MNTTRTPDLRADAEGRTWYGPAWHRRVEGLHVLHLQGTAYEMGRQHGALLKAAVPEGPIFYYRDYVARLMEQSGTGALTPLLWTTLRHTVGRRVAKALPQFAKDAMRGLADGAELSYREVLDGCVMPDSLMWVTARMIRAKRIDPAVRHRLQLGLGCTSALAWGDATADGRLLHARNLDYHGVESWPRHAAVIFHTPDEGHRYVAVASAGVLMGGHTAMNSAGLTLTVHQHMFTAETRLGGTPIATVGDQIMREASTLEEAEAILKAHRPIGCWTYLIAQGDRREVLCFEENPDRQVARYVPTEAGRFGYANIYLDEALGKTERDLYPSYWRHNRGRHAHVNRLLDQGDLDPNAMAAILGFEGSEGCRIRDSISMLMTVASVVFRPDDGTLWVATGEAPTSKNRYIPFSLEAMDHQPEVPALTGGQPANDARHAAFQAYRDAYVCRFERGDAAGARACLATAVELQPDEPLYRFVDALIAMDAGAVAEAAAQLDHAIELGHPDPERVAAFHLWRGRARDLLTEREGAEQDYRQSLGRPADPNVRAAAKKGLRRAYKAPKRINVEFSFADVLTP